LRDRVGKVTSQRLRQPFGVDPGIDRQPRRLREHHHGAADDRRPAEFPDIGKTYNIEWTQFQGTAPMT
jgi:hypothetical protein